MKFAEDWDAIDTTEGIKVKGSARAAYNYGGGQSSQVVTNSSARAFAKIVGSPTPTPGCYAGFLFGDDRENPITVTRRLSAHLQNDENGWTEFTGLFTGLPSTSSPLAISPVVTFFDDVGPIVEANSSKLVPIRGNRYWIGLRRTPYDGASVINRTMKVDIIVAGELRPERLRVEIEQERMTYVWGRAQSGGWRYQSSSVTDPIGEPIVEATISKTAKEDGCLKHQTVSLDLGEGSVGAYRVTVSTNDGVVASRRFVVGQDPDDKKVEKPNHFRLAVHRSAFKPGERLEVSPSDLAIAKGEILIGLARDGEIVAWRSTLIEGGKASPLSFRIPEEWRGGHAHLIGLAFGSWSKSEILPTRAVGLASIAIDASQRSVPLELSFRPVASPDQPVTATVRLGSMADRDQNLRPEDFKVALFAVDVGILSLTDHSILDPAEHFYGARQFGFSIQDLYGRVIRQLGESGGDELLDFRPEPYDSKLLIARVGEPKPFDSSGVARFELEAFQFTGSVRITAIAWNSTHTGFAQSLSRNAERSRQTADVNTQVEQVFDLDVGGAFELSVGAPTIMRPGDEAELVASLAAVEGESVAKTFTSDIWIRSGQDIAELTSTPDRILRVENENPARLKTLFKALKPGTVDISVRFTPDSGDVDPVEKTHRISIEDFEPPRTRIQHLTTLATGERFSADQLSSSLKLSNAAKVRLHAIPSENLPVGGLIVERLATSIQSLENLVAVGMLRVAQATEGIAVAPELALIGALQGSEGNFVETAFTERNTLQSQDSRTLRRSAFALDFMIMAKQSGVEVDQFKLENARRFVANELQRHIIGDEAGFHACDTDVYYAALVLARQNFLSQAAFREIEQCEHRRPFAGTLLVALALATDFSAVKAEEKLEEIITSYEKALSNEGASAILRNLAQSLALLAENQATDAGLLRLTNLVRTAASTSAEVSLQTAAWLARAQTALDRILDANKPVVRINTEGIATEVSGLHRWSSTIVRDLSDTDFVLENAGGGPIDIFAAVREAGKEDGSRGTISLRRRFFDREGREIGPGFNTTLRRNDLVYILLQGVAESDQPYRLLAPLPSGFDVERQFLTPDAVKAVFGERIEPEGTPSYFEALPDRMLAIMIPKSWRSSAPGRDGHFAFVFAARPTIAGRLTAPGAIVEEIASPEIYGETGDQILLVEP